MAEDFYFAGADSKVGIMVQTDFYDPDPDAEDTPPTWASGTKIGAVSGWSFNVAFDHKKLYAMSSTKRLAVARCKARVEGKLDFYKFDPTVSTFWAMKIANPSGGGTIADTGKFTFFMLYGSIKPFSTAGVVLGAKVYNVAFTNMPFGASEHEWIGWNLSFTGTNAEFVNAEVTFT
jgi:hypothetical protein